MQHTPTNETHRLLIIDDNPTIHEDIRKILCPQKDDPGVDSMAAELFGSKTNAVEQANFVIDSAFQGQEGLAKVEAAMAEGNPYMVAFVDVRMPPGWDGIETIRRIWEKYSDLQVVICTAYSDHSWEEIIGQLGHSDSLVILKKPFDNVEVLQLAHALTKKWSLTRKVRDQVGHLDELVRVRTEALSSANEQLQTEVKQRAEIEAALRASEERFEKAFTAASIPMAILNRETTRSLEVNVQLENLLGRSRQELINRPLSELNIFSRPEECQKAIEKLQSAGFVRNYNCRILDSSGTTHDILVSLEPVDLNGEECILVAMHDITEQLQLEARLRQSQKMEAVGQLAAGVAHDFNNLLTIIHGHSSLQLARADLDEKVVYSLKHVKMAADRAADLTKQLLAFSRKQVVKRIPLDLADVIKRVHPMLVRMVGETITLEQDCPLGLPPVHADQNSVDQILMNLVVNARDAISSNGRVRISAEEVTVVAANQKHPDARDGHFVRLTVQDNGSGIDTTLLGRLFEPFFTTKPQGKGTGLGLSTVYGIAQQHEGWVEVTSKRGVGSSFHVYLPVSEKPAAQTKGDTSFATRSFTKAKNNRTVLVVEDEEVLREFISETLQEYGFDVLQAGDGHEAKLVWRTANKPIDLLFTDMVMPNGLSGARLASELIHESKQLKVLYTSGYSSEAVENAELLVEGRNFLPKPFNAPTLIDAVENCLRTKATAPLNPAAN